MIQKNLEQVSVVKFILMKNGKILVERRRPDKKIKPNMIVIPAGKIEQGETPEQALFRESYEELNIKPKKYRFIGIEKEEYQKWETTKYYYLVTEWTGTIKKQEAEELIWITKEQINILDSEDERKTMEKVFL